MKKTFDELCDEYLAENAPSNPTNATTGTGSNQIQASPASPQKPTPSASGQPQPTPTPTQANQQTAQLKPEDVLQTLHDLADKNPQGLADVLKKIDTHNSQQTQQQNYNNAAENATH